MKEFDTQIHKDESGRRTIIELPFPAREVFCKPKGTVCVQGTINGIGYRSKLLSRGNGRFILLLDKAMQKSIGFDGTPMIAHITMACDDVSAYPEKDAQEPVCAACEMDALTAMKTRISIRKFTREPVGEEMANTILSAGMAAPTAKNKRPYHFIVIRKQSLLSELARGNANAAMLDGAACAFVICGDKNIEGMMEFLYADCAAAAQNMLLCIHALGLGGVWCGVAAHSDWRLLITEKLALPVKLEPVAVIAAGWPDEGHAPLPRWEPHKIHYDTW